MRPANGQWHDDETEGSQPTLSMVRDMIVDCFTATHGPRFGQTRAALGLDDAPTAVRESVEGMVRLAYTIAGGDFERPTHASTATVVNLLAERSAAWGVSEDEIFHHHCEMMRMLGLAHIGYTSRG